MSRRQIQVLLLVCFAGLAIAAGGFPRGAEWSLCMRNILNVRYADPVPEDFQQDAVRQDGRTLQIKVTRRL